MIKEMEIMLKDPKKIKKEETLKSDEQLVCAPEFTEGCIETEMDTSKGEQ